MQTPDADALRELLTNRRLTLRQAGEILGWSHVVVLRKAKLFGINRRRQTARGRESEIYEKFLDGDSVQAIVADGGPQPVSPWRCPMHGLVKFRPCVACLAELN